MASCIFIPQLMVVGPSIALGTSGGQEPPTPPIPPPQPSDFIFQTNIPENFTVNRQQDRAIVISAPINSAYGVEIQTDGTILNQLVQNTLPPYPFLSLSNFLILIPSASQRYGYSIDFTFTATQDYFSLDNLNRTMTLRIYQAFPTIAYPIQGFNTSGLIPPVVLSGNTIQGAAGGIVGATIDPAAVGLFAILSTDIPSTSPPLIGTFTGNVTLKIIQ